MLNDSRPDDRIDLSVLDPLRDDGRGSLDARAAIIARDAMDARQRLLAARSVERTSVVSALMTYALPTMLAAGLILAVALSAVVRTPAAAVRQVSAAEAMGIPRRLTDILQSTGTPSLVELGAALSVSASR
ncbi:MAG TPA: hypothetical protein VGH98_08890 [Gemmatimonadaceae bacterium]|jgi:hypothetical protein